MVDRRDVPENLKNESSTVTPIRLRSQQIKEPKPIISICDYNQEQVGVYVRVILEKILQRSMHGFITVHVFFRMIFLCDFT